jgi:hypothetical protein
MVKWWMFLFVICSFVSFAEAVIHHGSTAGATLFILGGWCSLMAYSLAVVGSPTRSSSTSREELPVSRDLAPYREALALGHALPDGPVMRCPQCGARAWICSASEWKSRCTGWTPRTDVEQNQIHCDRGNFSDRRPLAFTHFTSNIDYCTPQKRRRHGFLWLKRCAMPSLHYHQKCQRCGWRGVSLVIPEAEVP